MKKKPQRKIATSFRLSKTSYDMMYGLSQGLGISRGAVVEMALRALDRAFHSAPGILALARDLDEQEAK